MLIYSKTIAALRLEQAIEALPKIERNKHHARVHGVMEDLNISLKLIKNAPSKRVYGFMWLAFRSAILKRAKELIIYDNIKALLISTIISTSRRSRRIQFIDKEYFTKKQLPFMINKRDLLDKKFDDLRKTIERI